MKKFLITSLVTIMLASNASAGTNGENNISNKNRAPTFAITSKKYSSKILSSKLVENKIATRNDNFYAWRCLKALGINTEDGVVRTSKVHYNTEEDVNKLIKAFEKI